MNKTKKKISNRVLCTELRVALMHIGEHNFGYAKEIIAQILNRVNEYDLTPVKDEPKPIVSATQPQWPEMPF
jgi:hypothetical protein